MNNMKILTQGKEREIIIIIQPTAKELEKLTKSYKYNMSLVCRIIKKMVDDKLIEPKEKQNNI